MAFKRAFLSGLCLTAIACNSSSFEGASAKQPAAAKKPESPVIDSGAKVGVTPPSPAKPGTDDASGAAQTETFSITQNEGQVDVVWMIDNSGSMSEEAEQVRKNFASFVDSVQSRSDMHVALVSKSYATGHQGASTAVSLPASAMAAGGRQVDSYVGSNDELGLMAAAICAQNASDIHAGIDDSTITLADTSKICGQQLATDAFDELGEAGDAVGKLHDFFRPQAKKVFVFVTDDNAEGAVVAGNFLDLIRADVGGQDPAVFGFVGLNEQRTGCNISAVGTAYEELAFKTGGAVFDICDTDWSANFSKLGDNVAALAQTQFTVKMPVGTVTSVTVDGKPVPLSAVKASGSSVTIEPTAMPKGGKSITIVYKKS